jgi:hypothetical protein
MGDGLNNYKKLAERLTERWRQDISSKLKLDPEIKKLMDEMEEAKSKKQPSPEDKKKIVDLQLDLRKLAEKKMVPTVRKLEMDFNKLPSPEGVEPEKIRDMRREMIEDLEDDGIEIGRFKLGLDVDCNDSPGNVGLVRLGIRFGK